MRAHFFQHVPFEGLGTIESWLRNSGYEITATRFFESAQLPDLKAIDLLVGMGGPMSVNDEKNFSWLADEKQCIRAAIDCGKPVLGICLGAQLIAGAAGARVYRNSEKEIGWFPIQGIAHPDHCVFRFPPSVHVFHWHGETFDLPPRAVHIARSEGCENQAFQLGKTVIGLQFHLETTPAAAKALVAHCREELIPAKYVQAEADLLSVASRRYKSVNRLMGDVLSFLVANAKAA